ncbi:muscular LMNA-interacting protein isoform X9 [Ascaphus truei]|uniref:muscular LMNA-interacting protein isoform X9 n=1 Tax=Ascaphus truei TaxID=8439 RepID=UPI003F5923EF
MELEKYETETPSNKVLGKKIMISPVEPGTQPLTFSFVPIIGTLPTQVQVGKDSTFIPKIVKTLVSCRKEEMTHKPEQYPEHVSEKSIVGEDEGSLDPFCPTSTIEHIFPGKEVSSSNFEDMMQNDLFIAEFVLVMDSDEGEDDIMKKTDEILSFEEEGYESSGTQVSATPEPKGNLAEVNVNEICVPEAQHSDFLNYIDCPEKELQSYKIKSSYKAFAAIPTNTLLMDQKATDEPEINEANTTLEEKMETHSEVYSPAQLRQETEDICAAIDKVLHDPLPMQGNSPSRSSIMKLDSKTGKMPKPLPKSAGRETKYASIQPTMAAKANSQPTKPGMIRRLPLKVNLTKKKEDNSNRFKYFATSSSRRETDYVVSSVLGSCEPNQPCHGNKKMDTKMDNEKDLEQQHNVFK